ncbi:hypothetical protein I4F81_001942 [Pyropia yezoensis]|uniref:Uncharacterized protein n=1 Tax=Pyropia yezoensis TaxID=2788 RepID=A0ACC3BN54_PYRYE|nr:hypothetical protein I4F81_001942 [Neopyropia yezoensis]
MAPKRKPPRQKTTAELTVARLRDRAVGRRSRYLFLLPGGLSLTAGARIGHLAALDTPTPVLYIEFGPAAWGGDEVGRLKCWGVHFYPRNAVLTLRGGGAGKAAVCEDVMETVVVFGEWAWVGGAAGNPTEAVLPLPAGLAAVVGEGGGADIWPKGGAEAAARGRAEAAGGRGGGGGGGKRPAEGEAICLDGEEEAEAEEAAAYEGGLGGLDGGAQGVDTPARRTSTRKRARHDDVADGYGEVRRLSQITAALKRHVGVDDTDVAEFLLAIAAGHPAYTAFAAAAREATRDASGDDGGLPEELFADVHGIVHKAAARGAAPPSSLVTDPDAAAAPFVLDRRPSDGRRASGGPPRRSRFGALLPLGPPSGSATLVGASSGPATALGASTGPGALLSGSAEPENFLGSGIDVAALEVSDRELVERQRALARRAARGGGGGGGAPAGDGRDGAPRRHRIADTEQWELTQLVNSGVLSVADVRRASAAATSHRHRPAGAGEDAPGGAAAAAAVVDEEEEELLSGAVDVPPRVD